MNIQHPAKRSQVLAAAVAVLLSGAALAQAPIPQSNAAAVQDIRDIRGPKPVASAWWVALLLAGAVTGAGAGCAAWAWHRRRRLLERSPQEIALAGLDAARALIQEGNSRAYSIELSGITRQYIEDAFGIVATHFTTDEFLRHFASTPNSVLIGSQELLGDFLQACDLAKFGGWNVTAPGMLEMLESARHFIVDSGRPRAMTSQVRAVETCDSQETYASLPTT